MARSGSTSERVYETLRDDILAWRLPAGAALSEVDLADRLGVSRTPLRDALARLAIEGLIDTSRGRTAVVADLSADSVRELFELREALEVHSARLAARRGDPTVFAALAEGFADARRVLAEEGADAYFAAIGRFDEAVDVAIGNPRLRHALTTVRTHLVRARRLSAENHDRLLHAADEHRAICAAVADGDEHLAAAATVVHLRASLGTILATLETRSDVRGTA